MTKTNHKNKNNDNKNDWTKKTPQLTGSILKMMSRVQLQLDQGSQRLSADDALHRRRWIVGRFRRRGATDAVAGVGREMRGCGAAMLPHVGEELFFVLKRHFADDADVSFEHFAMLQLVLGQDGGVGEDLVANVAFQIRRHHVRLHVFLQFRFRLEGGGGSGGGRK